MKHFTLKIRYKINNTLINNIVTVMATIFFEIFSAQCQNMPATGNGIPGFNHIPVGWSNASDGGGTPDLSTINFAIFPYCLWNVSPADFSTIILPAPPTGSSVFADVWTTSTNIERIGTTITNLLPNSSYTIKIYLLTAVSLIATTNMPATQPIFFPTSVDITFDGITSTVQLDSSTNNNWRLFSFTFTANSTTALFKIGNARPYPVAGGGGFVCISIGDNAISCSNNNFLGPDKVLCTGDTLILNPDFPNAIYLWQDSSTNPNYTVTGPGTYTVAILQPNCWAFDSINVYYNPVPMVILGNDTALCNGMILSLNPFLPNASYLWQDNSTTPFYLVDHAGNYSVVVDLDGCKNTGTINVEFKALPIVDLGEDTKICINDPLKFNVSTPGGSYLWQDGSVNPDYTVTGPGTYWVAVESNGCYNADTIVIGSKYCSCIINIPNAITPNGDGINDKWIFTDQNCIQHFDVSVYNRFGNLIYEKKNYQNDWKGTYKLKIVPDGTYYYIIKAVRFDKQVQLLKGNVTIIK